HQGEGGFQFAGVLLEALPVEGVALEQVIAQGPSGPDAELGAALRVDPIADGYDGIEVVELDCAGHGFPSFKCNCCIFCNSCIWSQFSSRVDVPEVPGDYRLVTSEQVGHLSQRQPYCFAVQPDIYLYL